MDIGISLGGFSVVGLGTSAPVGPTPDPFGPITGVLDAANVVLLGASIYEGAFEVADVVRSSLQDYATAAGFTGTVQSYATGGNKTADAITQHATAKADLSSDEGSNLYVVHIGGNDISGARPYPGGATTFDADYTTLMGNITATDMVVPLPLTKRLYGIDDPAYPAVADAVVQGDAASEDNGSKPYNEAIILPAIAAHAPDWLDSTSEPYVNPYTFVDRDPAMLGADGVHGGGFNLATYTLSHLAGRALGKRESDPRAGQSLIFNFSKESYYLSSIGPINKFKTITGSDPDKVFIYGAVCTDGSFDPFIKTRIGPYRNSTTGMDASAYPRLADTRFHDLDIVGAGIYVQGSDVFTVHFENLTPGETVTVSCCGVRSSAGTARRAEATLTGGQSLVLDAATISASNQIVFDPIVVPSDGVVQLDLAVLAGSTYGYLHGVILDFAP